MIIGWFFFIPLWALLSQLPRRGVFSFFVTSPGPKRSYFGKTVIISNNRILVGSSKNAYIYEKVNNVWTQTSQLVPDNTRSFSAAYAIDGNYIVAIDNGVILYEFINDEWIGAISMSSMTNMVLYGRVQESDEVFEQLIITKTDYFESLSDPDIVEMF